jgi:hypothetical protein
MRVIVIPNIPHRHLKGARADNRSIRRTFRTKQRLLQGCRGSRCIEANHVCNSSMLRNQLLPWVRAKWGFSRSVSYRITYSLSLSKTIPSFQETARL